MTSSQALISKYDHIIQQLTGEVYHSLIEIKNYFGVDSNNLIDLFKFIHNNKIISGTIKKEANSLNFFFHGIGCRFQTQKFDIDVDFKLSISEIRVIFNQFYLRKYLISLQMDLDDNLEEILLLLCEKGIINNHNNGYSIEMKAFVNI